MADARATAQAEARWGGRCQLYELRNKNVDFCAFSLGFDTARQLYQSSIIKNLHGSAKELVVDGARHGEHCEAAVLDLHELLAGHVLLAQAKGVCETCVTIKLGKASTRVLFGMPT